MMMNILPFYSLQRNILIQGEAFTAHNFCIKKNHSKCDGFYKSIKEPGLYMCPYGYNSYATKNSLAEGKIYTSIIVRNFKHDRHKISKHGERKNFFEGDEITRLIGLSEMDDQIINTAKETESKEESIVHAVFHEIRALSRDLDTYAVYLQQFSSREDEPIPRIIDTIERTIKLISIRIDSYELLKNPETIITAKQPKIAIYKKFDKSRYILNSRATDKKCHILFKNECHLKIDGYEIFDLLPFIILDNSVKYTPRGDNIEITFDELHRTVSINNIGPFIEPNERKDLCISGFRGKYSKKHQGSGIGLNMMKQIADLHDIKYDIICGNEILKEIEGIPHANFTVFLRF